MKGIQNKIMRTNVWKMATSFSKGSHKKTNWKKHFVKTAAALPKRAKTTLESFSNYGPRKTSHVGQARAGQEVRKWLGRKCERPRAREKGFNAYCHA